MIERTSTLLLTSWFFPHRVVRWQDAVTLLYTSKAERVIDYGHEIRSPSLSMKAPAVIRLRRSFGKVKRGPKFSRINVFTRDGFRCQYCGERHIMSKLSYDHVTPRACGGRTEWTNIVTACVPCNSRKGSRTTDEAGMFPLRKPVRPKTLPMTGPFIDVARAPREWHDFLVVTA